MAHDDTAYELFCHCYRDCPRTKFPQPLLASEARPALASISRWAPAAPACAGDSSASSLHASILSFRLQSILRNRRCSGRVKMKCFERPTQELLRRLDVVWLARSRLCDERVSLPMYLQRVPCIRSSLLNSRFQHPVMPRIVSLPSFASPHSGLDISPGRIAGATRC